MTPRRPRAVAAALVAACLVPACADGSQAAMPTTTVLVTTVATSEVSTGLTTGPPATSPPATTAPATTAPATTAPATTPPATTSPAIISPATNAPGTTLPATTGSAVRSEPPPGLLAEGAGSGSLPTDRSAAAPPDDQRDTSVASLQARAGVEAVVATVVDQDGMVQAWSAPLGGGDTTAPAVVVPARNEFGGPAHFLVEEQIGDWLRVQLPVRPNGSEGWIARGGVTLAPVSHRVEIALGERRLRVLQGDDVVLESPVAIGRPSAPTPTGRYYVRDSFSWDPYSVYGPYVLPLSAYSESIEAINGGEAVIAIHGTNRPESVGRAASLGCLRLDNETVTALAHLVSSGTPVLITP